MSTRRRRRLDEQAKEQGWTHRWKGKSRDPYLKIRTRTSDGAQYIDMDQKYRWVHRDEVVEL